MSEIRIIESTNYKGVQMSKKNTSLRLTERDTEYIIDSNSIDFFA
jgi:hypothetical protein